MPPKPFLTNPKVPCHGISHASIKPEQVFGWHFLPASRIRLSAAEDQHKLSPLPGAPGLPKTAGCCTVQYTTEHTGIDE